MSVAWEIPLLDPDQIKKLSSELGVSEILGRVLINRGVDTLDKGKAFLENNIDQVHNPFLFQDMEKACEKIFKTISDQEKICIYGDYDVDGTTATSLLVLFFQGLGVPVEYYIPNRLKEGYSLNKNAIEFLAKQKTKLIITVDNGIMAHEGILFANSLGIDVIVTDHHQVGETLPEAHAIVNPQRQDCPYPFKGICGAGVAFKLMLALRQILRKKNYFQNHKEPNLKQYLDLLAIPTVCDVVPLVGENRFFVKEGLKHLGHTKRVGLKALLQICKIKSPIDAYDLGFRVGPRLNACGRLEEASLGVQLLTSENGETVWRIAKKLDELNQERKMIEEKISKTAISKIAEKFSAQQMTSLVVYEEKAHLGVVGLVASRLVEEFYRPSFVLCKMENGLVKGSGRSIPKVNLVKALKDCEDILLNFGGHEAAAGVTLEEKNVITFKEKFEKAIAKQISPKDLIKTIKVDTELFLNDIQSPLLQELELLKPNGMKNPKPVFVGKKFQISHKRIVGNDHLKLQFTNHDTTVEAIAFRQAKNFNRLEKETDLLFHLEINRFNDKEIPQIVVKEFLF